MVQPYIVRIVQAHAQQQVWIITLNLKDDRGKEMFLNLAQQSDILVENLSPGSMGRLGLGYDEVSKVNPEIIYASISGYGQTGKYSSHKAHDPQIQGMSGIMDINTIMDKTAPRRKSSPVYPLVILMLFVIESIILHSSSIKK